MMILAVDLGWRITRASSAMFRKKRNNPSFPASESKRIEWVRQLAEGRRGRSIPDSTLMAEPEATLLQLVEDYIYWRKLGYEPQAALLIINRDNEGQAEPARALPPEPWDLSAYAYYLLGLVHVQHGGLDGKATDRVLTKFLNAYKMRGACDDIQRSYHSEYEHRRSKRHSSPKRIGWRTKIECPHCGQRIGVSTAELGQSAPCPNCKVTLDVPAITQRCVPLRGQGSSQIA